ncbi:MAG: methionyl-tRNA formyltransferase [Deltaproteobacteria bacterium]|nr:methionyl-tRNA formyltransferase [Candidatus Anaeroferrophillus wilburensis]MBN2890126.1 methionyl-tRNA formyltransferase [Deltaproteobacteria bacterium]
MRIILAATGAFAVPSLEVIADHLQPENLLIISQPDRRRGRGRHLQPFPVKQLAMERQLVTITPEKITSSDIIEQCTAFAPDFLVAVDYGQIIPASLISVPSQAAVNLHPSLLPAYRGPAPMVWTLLNGDPVTGVTTQLLAPQVDRGDILLQEKVAVEQSETLPHLTDRLRILGAKLLWETLKQWQAGRITPRQQDEAQASYAPMLKKEDGLLDWQQDAEKLERQIRALNPWPGTFTFWQGKRFKILAAEIPPAMAADHKAPGTVLIGDGRILLATGSGFLQITSVQAENRPRRSAGEFLRGSTLKTGDRFTRQPLP